MRISIHALRVEGDRRTRAQKEQCRTISIHALRVEGDGIFEYPEERQQAISIHALRVEGDHSQKESKQKSQISIHALRVEGDRILERAVKPPRNFYPRPPGGGRQARATVSRWQTSHFYPRPPGGGRPRYSRGRQFWAIFLSTPSGWRATRARIFCAAAQHISIHALRVEGDGLQRSIRLPQVEFLSTPSGWRATRNLQVNLQNLQFLSTPSGWRATYADGWTSKVEFISIHALRVEGDRGARKISRRRGNFYPRPPGGGRPFWG